MGEKPCESSDLDKDELREESQPMLGQTPDDSSATALMKSVLSYSFCITFSVYLVVGMGSCCLKRFVGIMGVSGFLVCV